MTDRKRLVWLWVVLGLLVLVVMVPFAGPLHRAWSCYWLHKEGDRADAELVEKLEGDTLLLRFVTGPQVGQACTARSSRRIYEETEPGQAFEVVYFEDRPGDCVLSSTVETSGIVLGVISVGLGSLLLMILGFGIWVHRSYITPGLPQRRMEVDPGAVLCPVCGGKMDEGYLPLLAGMHWRLLGEPIRLPHALSGLPGTVGWRGRPLLHGFHCSGCEVITFQYGGSPGKRGRAGPPS